ncbi:hypothetical protein [Polaromonas sp. JS666]|uniref:hypothetical protein n=1 Tax=Polaromonas sp. (strain JS666 / ATCC BAA-500) TaxID=296591 RepID=UPI00005340F6|nr:hypothetical protein [Polaromonas sp. JS666]ABE43655.1 hypothetical protein Bpro_1719 [Polaromonas sp. JS666]
MKHLVLLTALFSCTAPGTWAQSFCASDGQPRPAQLMERFINADCDSCWTDPATPKAGAGQIALDWVVPGSKGDDAPLSAVATRDALARLEASGQAVPAKASNRTHSVNRLTGSTLRVAHGLPLADYLGASIELKPIPPAARGQRWTAWLALVETLPAGTEGSPTERNLVRNLLQVSWDGRKLSNTEQNQNRFFEARSMAIAQGANAGRLRVIGWVEDEKNRVRAAAQSRCEASPQTPSQGPK